jgi:signal transduction histidine kinase
MNPLFVDRVLLGGSLTFWVMVIIEAHIVYALSLALCRLLYFRKSTMGSRPIAVVFSLIVGQSLRGMFIGAISVSEGLTTDPNLRYRIVFGCAVLVPMAVLVGLVVSIWDQHQNLINSLSRQRIQLISLAQNMQIRLEEINNELQTFVRRNITTRINELNQTLDQIEVGGDVSSAISELQILVDEDLRPMSKTLARSTQEEIEVPIQVQPIHLRFEAPDTLCIRESIYLKTSIPILIALQFAPATRFLSGIDLIAFLVFLSLATPLVIYSFIRVMARREFRTIISGIIICSFYTAVGPLIVVSSRILNLSGLVHVTGLISILFAEAIVGLLLGIGNFGYAVLTANRLQTISQLRSATEELESSLSFLRQHSWSRRRQLAHALHGNLQSALLVATIKLSETENLTRSDINKIRSDISEALESIENLNVANQTINDVMLRLIAVWGDTVKLRWTIDGAAEQKLLESNLLMESVSEVIREGITNATKHGHCTTIQISIELVGRDLRVQIADNGVGIKAGLTPSLGTELLNEVCLSWSLTPNPDQGATLDARFA